jgi:outer membrane receptor for ferrienterochelin and colicin
MQGFHVDGESVAKKQGCDVAALYTHWGRERDCCVNASALQVNSEQPGVSDVISREQIEKLPVNGRSFLDLAQIEPGVILQSGESFDPTKAGYSAIATSGVSGRTTRILLDGQDITDESVGTTIFNVSQGAIGDFQLNRSTQDVSGDVTSTGQILCDSHERIPRPAFINSRPQR